MSVSSPPLPLDLDLDPGPPLPPFDLDLDLGGLEKDMKKRRELSPESLTESSTRATSTTVPSKRNKHEANEPKSVQWEPEISGESGSVGSSNHELREPGLEPDLVQGDLEPNQEGTSARSADAGPSEPFREPALGPLGLEWEPKHRIFLSHSGAQKDFTEHLCDELERVQHFPFFDRRDDSLRKGERFFSPLIKACNECRIAVLVLSEEYFTNSKWPMMELNKFVKAQESTNSGLKILPLFLEIAREQFNEKERQELWLRAWKKMKEVDDTIDLDEWQHALSRIQGNNGMHYGGATQGKSAFIKEVVAGVCKLLPPDVKYDMSHVQSMEQLCQPILRKLRGVEPSGNGEAGVVGIHGMGGVGKTTISKALCNQMVGDFVGKACHIEFGGSSLLNLRKKVLQDLTEADARILVNEIEEEKLVHLLKERMHRQKVFLVLDNVGDHQVEVEEAIMYLKLPYHEGSIVLLTSRSLDILHNRLHISRLHCMEMPNLGHKGAIDVFLHYSGISKDSIKDDELNVVIGCVEECRFGRGGDATSSYKAKSTYHPLALKVLGSQFRSIGLEVCRWKESLGKLKVDKFNMLKDKKHPIFSVLRLGYDVLRQQEQYIFLDLSLVFVSKGRGLFSGFRFKWEWLCMVHKTSEADMKESINALKRKGLLDKVDDIEELEFTIHDLYIEFAKTEAQAGPFERRRFLIDKKGANVPHELLKRVPSAVWPSLERLIIQESKVQSLKRANLHQCKNVEVLVLDHCKELKEVDVTEMDNLQCLVVNNCESLRQVLGLDTLCNLVYLFWASSRTVFADLFLPDLRGCTELLEITFSCTELLEITFPCTILSRRYRTEVKSALGSCFPESLMKIDLSRCLACVGSSPTRSMSPLTNLQDLNLNGCKETEDLIGLCALVSLQKLNVGGTRISKLPDDMKKLKHLQSLDVSYCSNLRSIIGIAHVTALQHLNASKCRNLDELPDDFSKLKMLETIDLSEDTSICKLPNDYEVLGSCSGSERILKVKLGGCYGLIVPLVKKLQGLEASRVKCIDACSGGCESMQLWIDAKENIDIIAFDMLRNVISNKDLSPVAHRGPLPLTYWTYLLENGEVHDVVIRALCEHEDRGGEEPYNLVNVVGEVTDRDSGAPNWWTVVVTASCTFRVVLERAMLKPWRYTLLHHTMITIVPSFLWSRSQMVHRIKDRDGDNDWEAKTCLYRAIVVVLQKCKEETDKASDQGIHPERNNEWKKVLDTILKEIEAAKGLEMKKGSMLRMLYYRAKGGKYSYKFENRFPNFPFEQIPIFQGTCDSEAESDFQRYAEITGGPVSLI